MSDGVAGPDDINRGTEEERQHYKGAVGWRNLPNGDVIVLEQQIGSVAIHLGKQLNDFFEKEWSYPLSHVGTAIKVLETWDGEGDPLDGWVRAYPPYYRRRTDGDPEKEFEAP